MEKILVIGSMSNMWFNIIKQGKILTLPKTQLRIKKPINEEVDRDCKQKLLDYATKLTSIPMNFIESNLAPDVAGTLEIKGEDKLTSTGIYRLQYSLKGHDKKIPEYRFQYTRSYFAREEITAPSKESIEEIPEKVCCAALDMLNSAKTENAVAIGEEKEIGGWQIHVWKSKREWHNYGVHKRFMELVLSIDSKERGAVKGFHPNTTEWAWEHYSTNAIWKDGFEPDIEWR